MSRTASTGVKVIIVGAGFAGLTTAIECYLKGHSVTVLESFPVLKPLGDIISFAPNAGRIIHRWPPAPISTAPTVAEQYSPICLRNDIFTFRRWDGEFLTTQPVHERKEDAPEFSGHRGAMHQILFEYAKALGIDIRLGLRVVQYVEETDRAGVRYIVRGADESTPEPEVMWADIVVGSDGVRSKARELVLGYVDNPKPSGYAVYRAWMDASSIAQDPLTAHLVAGADYHVGWFGPDVHFIFAYIQNTQSVSWVCTHKDDADIEESWSFPGKLADVLKVLDGWDPVARRIVQLAESCVDWKLVYRDPLERWVSKAGRICLLGDSAHPFLPTSIQGASQAMEDGVVLATCLSLAVQRGDPLPDAVRAYEKLRYDRVRRAQVLGETNRDKWHKADFDKVKEDPEGMKLGRDEWLFAFDVEKDACERYAAVVDELKKRP
ncbi:FAD/NAD(P)-binding domain-containing protein [Heliocybe sulcata]|uniref:FAD/NAD(P)-binding domain-containing protein n=1 Tax=Heliocybe sulcata TaxID=5364 RepID=A0A5C3ML74_9AGAM|nr:FAD/NAD(P)-binding domain-containing protein [Heliocybe sulcata]